MIATDDGDDDDREYNNHRRRQGKRAREQSTEARDIGPIPKIVNPRRRKTCERDLRRYLLTYYAESFPLPFSDDHERILKEIESRALEGGLKAIAMPRGSGKTTILLRAINWVLSYGHRRFAVLVEADEGAAEESMDAIKTEWETNDLLLADFPEIAYPIRRLEGITQRGNAQTSMGERTLIGWRRKELIFPTVAKSVASGATIRCAGILGRIRGMNRVAADGKTLRPDFTLINDPQTDASAISEIECAKREKVTGGAVLGLAGPGKRIAGFAAVTVIREGDAADRLLNRKIMPKWHGDRCRLVYEWPTNKELWAKYLEIRAEEIDSGDDVHPKANAFYKKNRAAMDAGAKVGWAHRKFEHELSAIQHAINLRADNPDTFDAEYQNEPKTVQIDTGDFPLLSSDDYCLRVLPTHRRGELPNWVQHLSLGIDVQGSSLWWTLAGVGEDFTGLVVDYGVWPEQGIDYVSLKEIDRTIAMATKIKQPAEALIAALRTFTNEQFSRRLVRDDGGEMRITGCIVDAGYQSEAVYRFAQETGLAIMPSHGKGVGAKERPWSQHRKKMGERMGYGWRIPPAKGVRAPRYVLIDTNEWKTCLARCWATPHGEPGAWSLYRAAPLRHRMIADNLSAEYPIKTQGHGRELYEWSLRPGRDNHLFDSTILAAVGAAIAGARVPGQALSNARPGRRVSLSNRSATPTGAPGTHPPAASLGDASKGLASGKKSLAELRAERRKGREAV